MRNFVKEQARRRHGLSTIADIPRTERENPNQDLINETLRLRQHIEKLKGRLKYEARWYAANQYTHRAIAVHGYLEGFELGELETDL